jgi:hypothetical protein
MKSRLLFSRNSQTAMPDHSSSRHGLPCSSPLLAEVSCIDQLGELFRADGQPTSKYKKGALDLKSGSARQNS